MENTLDKLIITALRGKTAAVLFKDGHAAQIDFEPEAAEEETGVIFVGKVKNISKNINAAFVEYRPGVNGFYSLKENARPIYADGKTEHGPLKAGDEILVQVERSAVKTKDAVLTSNLTLTGQTAVLSAGKSSLGISAKIRGRIGRSNRTSYAFLMYKRDKMLKEDAEKRLQAIREFTELGSGIKIAMRDLEIRGAGNILGAEQHGHMEAVGYDLYCKMLNEAVIALKGGQEEEETFETVVDCDIDAFIPDGYIKNEYLKLDVYKRISAIETDDEYMDMQDELIDRFGDIPKSVDNLLRVAELKAMAHRAYVTEVDINTQEIRIELYPKAKLDVTGIPALIAEYKTALRFAQGEKPVLFYQDKGKKHKDCEPMMEKAKELLGKLGELAESRK